MMPIKLKALAIGLTATAIASSPAHAVPDESGGAAPRSATPTSAEGFDWSDAGIGLGIGAAAGATAVGTAVAVRRRIAPHDAAGPVAR